MQPITPLDPTSPKGREVAGRLTETLAAIRLEIAARKNQTDTTRRAAA